jgi:glycosyltransferase involved in cell wall biosynthesis
MLISAVIITKNEEENLKKSLPKLFWCDEIIIVDDHSTDNTVELAKQYNCKVYNYIFENFGKQKRLAVSLAQNNWVLSLDADEVLSDELINELKSLNEDKNIEGYLIPRQHVFLNTPFKYGKESKDYILRLFNKEKGNFNEANVHEKVILQGNSSTLKGNILHYSYKNLDHYFSKFNQYTTKGAIQLREKGKKRALILCILSFPVYFFKHYFLYLNILNGNAGFVWSYLSAWYHTVKYLKLYELNKKENS